MKKLRKPLDPRRVPRYTGAMTTNPTTNETAAEMRARHRAEDMQIVALVTAMAVALVLWLTGVFAAEVHERIIARDMATLDAGTCEEDEPCWDCETMGNGICGPSTDGRFAPCGQITEHGVTENLDAYAERCENVGYASEDSPCWADDVTYCGPTQVEAPEAP